MLNKEQYYKILEVEKATDMGQMFCREALEKCDWDIEKAIKLLREKGIEIIEDIHITYRENRDRAEYVCPRCGEKTYYAKEMLGFLNSELNDIRKIVKEIKNITVYLDEKQFCKTCGRKESDNPKLCLVVKLNGNDIKKIFTNSYKDYIKIREILSAEINLDDRGYSQILERIKSINSTNKV